MTKQTHFAGSLVGSSAGFGIRVLTLTLAAILIPGSALKGAGQNQQPAASPPAPAKPSPPPAPSPSDTQKKMGHYMVHSMVEMGSTITERNGSYPMWATMVNQGTGLRLIGQSLDMHSTDTTKTPFLDTLSTASFGYGGEPYDTTYLKMSKGRWYDFAGNFRRDRYYFDYNLSVNPFLTSATNATPVLVPVPSSLHLFNTVRRNTDTLFTLLPISKVSFRAGYNHGTNEGPTYSSVHGGGDVSVMQWYRYNLDTYIGGVDFKLTKRTMLSYDQFYGLFKGDSWYELANAQWTLANGTPVSQGFTVLTGPTVTCGSGAGKGQNVLNGISNPFCNQTITQNQNQPTRTQFPTEQLRFSSHYWNKMAMNGRYSYSGGVSNVNGFNEVFNGFLSRTTLRQQVDAGILNASGRLANNKRINVNGDYSLEATLNHWLAVSDTVTYWDWRIPGHSYLQSQIWDNTPIVPGGPPPVSSANLNVNTPLSALHNYTTSAENFGYVGHKNLMNTAVASFTVLPEFKFSAGWRFNNRDIKFGSDPLLAWHQNGVLLGAVIQPSRAVRVNLNAETMKSDAANSNTLANTYTRLASNETYRIQGRAIVSPKKWLNLAIAANDFHGVNNDPLVNHTEYARDFSFAAQFIPTEKLSIDVEYAHDVVFSQTDLCYVFTATPNAAVPAGATNAGTCVQTPSNPTASSNLYLGYGSYNAPSNFYLAAVNYAPSRILRFNGGFRETGLGGTAELLNPYNPTGALSSNMVTPFADMRITVGEGWAWHGMWEHHGYNEDGGPGGNANVAGSGIPSREFHGDVITLSVIYAF